VRSIVRARAWINCCVAVFALVCFCPGKLPMCKMPNRSRALLLLLLFLFPFLFLFLFLELAR
jgi:hypothetical protein